MSLASTALIVGGVGAAATAGTALYGAGQSKKAQRRAMNTATGAPQYGRTMKDVLSNQGKIANKLFQLESAYQPKYAGLQSQIQGQLASEGMRQMGGLYGQAADIETQYLNKVRGGDIASMQKMLPQYQKAFESLYPGTGQANAAMGQLASQATQQALNRPEYTAFEQGVGGPIRDSELWNVDQGLVDQYMAAQPGVENIAGQLSQQAQSDLAAGRSLTPEEERMSQQAARQAYAARGTASGPQSMAAEVLNRADVAQQRYQQRQQSAQQIAGTVAGLYAPALQQSFQRQMGGENYELGAQQQAFNQALQRGQAEIGRDQSATASQAAQAALGQGALQTLNQNRNDILQAYYRTPLLANLPGQQQAMALQSQQAMGPQFFNPESSMGFQSAFMPYQGRLSAALGGMTSTAANNASMQSAVGSAFGTAGDMYGSYAKNFKPKQ